VDGDLVLTPNSYIRTVNRIPGVLTIWSLYEDPIDYPGQIVARMFLIRAGQPPLMTNLVILTDNVDRLHSMFTREGLVFTPRLLEDDPCVVGAYI